MTTLFIIAALLQIFAAEAATTSPVLKQEFSFLDSFSETRDLSFFEFAGASSIDGGALQLTPDSLNDDFISTLYNSSGRIMYHQPFKLWTKQGKTGGGQQDVLVASFTSFFYINVFRKPAWDAGQGLAFVIAPNVSLPDASSGQWLGLTNASTDGNEGNRIVAIEFDTEKQDFDIDDNHIGLNVNSVVSRNAVSLNNSGIEISPEKGTNYSVWVQYNGSSKLMDIYMITGEGAKPETPIMSETINLQDYVNAESYLGFSASTGYPQIELNCVLRWTFDLETLPSDQDDTWVKIVIGVVVPVGVLVIAAVILLVYCRKRYRKTSLDNEPNVPETVRRLPGLPREFKYNDLKKATNNFDTKRRLGQGGFGIVYKGILPLDSKEDPDATPSRREIAVKKFSRESIKGIDDFLCELAIIHQLRHKNLVHLVGWCQEKGKLLLVYDYLANGSLEKHLHTDSNQKILNWEKRYKIIRGVASALHYLQNEYIEKVVHRDLKPSNIMLDSDYNARLGDFGLARLLDNGMTSYVEQGLAGVPGTMGYVAPECFHTGKATPESDIYGFGAVILEVVCGRIPGVKISHQQDHFFLVDWVWMLHREGRILEAIDERLKDDYVTEQAKTLLLLGLACSHPIASERPQTQHILQIISGTLPPPYVPPFKPNFTWNALGIGSPQSTSSVLSKITLSS